MEGAAGGCNAVMMLGCRSYPKLLRGQLGDPESLPWLIPTPSIDVPAGPIAVLQ